MRGEYRGHQQTPPPTGGEVTTLTAERRKDKEDKSCGKLLSLHPSIPEDRTDSPHQAPCSATETLIICLDWESHLVSSEYQSVSLSFYKLEIR